MKFPFNDESAFLFHNWSKAMSWKNKGVGELQISHGLAITLATKFGCKTCGELADALPGIGTELFMLGESVGDILARELRLISRGECDLERQRQSSLAS